MSVQNQIKAIASVLAATKPKESRTPLKAMQVVCEWQNYGSGVRGMIKSLNSVLTKLPVTKPYAGTVYRVIALNAKMVKTLLSEGQLASRELESWTKDPSLVDDYVRNNSGMIDPKGDSVVLAVFKAKVDASQVALDIESLWKNSKWRKDYEYYDLEGEDFSEGSEFEGSQREVVVRREFVELSEVHELYLPGTARVKGNKAILVALKDSVGSKK